MERDEVAFVLGLTALGLQMVVMTLLFLKKVYLQGGFPTIICWEFFKDLYVVHIVFLLSLVFAVFPIILICNMPGKLSRKARIGRWLGIISIIMGISMISILQIIEIYSWGGI